MLSGDEFYGDEITSGIFDDDDFHTSEAQPCRVCNSLFPCEHDYDD